MITTDSREQLYKSQSFAELDNKSIELIFSICKEVQFAKKNVIVSEGDKNRNLFFITGGIAKAYKVSPDGKEQIIMLLRSGDYFNETILFDDQPIVYSVEAITPVSAVEINCSDFRDIAKDKCEISLWASKLLTNRNRYLVSLVEDLSFRTVTGRVAKILLNNLYLNDEQKRMITQRDMAAIAGTAREVVSRALKSLEDDGYINIDKSHIKIIDAEGLKDIVENLE